MTRDEFLQAAAKAAEYKVRADIAFAGLQRNGENIRDASAAVRELARRISELKAGPDIRGSAAAREIVGNELFMLERGRAEAANVLATANRLTAELQETAYALARQRDSTAEMIVIWRRELDAVERIKRPSMNYHLSNPGGKR